jgi:GTP cyclohydrolase I
MTDLWGDRLSSSDMIDTPDRVLKYWKEMSSGLNQDPIEPLLKQFDSPSNEIVLVKDIPFQSLCEHHLLPFFGTASVAYIPSGKIAGLSKFARSLDILAKRPQVQERLTYQLGNAIKEALNPKGTAVIIKAEHTCMSARGVLKQGSSTVTSFIDGIFMSEPNAKLELMELMKL